MAILPPIFLLKDYNKPYVNPFQKPPLCFDPLNPIPFMLLKNIVSKIKATLYSIEWLNLSFYPLGACTCFLPLRILQL